MKRIWIRALAGALLLCLPAFAQLQLDKKGPAKVTIGDNMATLNLPKGLGFLNGEHTRAQMEKSGQGKRDDVMGAILPLNEKEDWAIILSYDELGYVKDDDADKLNADEILKSLKEGTEAENESRKEHGAPELHVLGWDEAPHYDKTKHTVIWSVLAKSGDTDIVNYNSRVLGRKGVLSVNLVCDKEKLAAYKGQSAKILGAIAYNQGQRYEDYQTGDKISAGGIAALILGGAVLKKAGVLGFLLALFKPMLLFLKKFVVLIVVAVVGAVKGLLGKKQEEPPPPPAE